jgi:hypothetical protein
MPTPNNLEEVQARLADISIKMENLSLAYQGLIDEMIHLNILQLHGDAEHLKMPSDPELGDIH